MSDLRDRVVEAMAQAAWRDTFGAVTRVESAPRIAPKFDDDPRVADLHREQAEVALDAALDVLEEVRALSPVWRIRTDELLTELRP